MLVDTEIEVEVTTSPASALHRGGCALNCLLLKPLVPELRAQPSLISLGTLFCIV